MNNKTLIFAIVAVIAVTVIILATRNNGTNGNGTPTLTPTPSNIATSVPTTVEPTSPFTATDTPIPSVSPSFLPTVSPSPSPTPGSSFTDIVDTNWIYGVTQQTVGGYVYFIDATNKNTLKRGTSTTDTSAKTLMTTDTGRDILSFIVNGNYVYVVTAQDPTTKISKFQRLNLNTSAKTRLFDFEAQNFTIAQFAVLKNDDTKSGFYLGITATDGKQTPGAVYIQNYSFAWMRSFTGTNTASTISGLAPKAGGGKLVGLFSKDSVQSIAYIDL